MKNFDETTADEIVNVFMAGLDAKVFDGMKKEVWRILPTSGVLWLWKESFKEKSESPLWLAFEYNEKGEITFLQFGDKGLKFNQIKAFAELEKLNLSFQKNL